MATQNLETAEQILRAVTKLKKRINELDNFPHGDDLALAASQGQALVAKIGQTLSDIFGHGSVDYERYYVGSLYVTSAYLMNTSTAGAITAYKNGAHRARERLGAAVEILHERLEDLATSPQGKAQRAIEGLDLHPEIAHAAGQLYRDGHYANSIEDAVKALNNLVRLRTGVEQDGVSLMQHVFSPKSPILQFNALADDSDRNEQLGFMQLFCGAVTGLRNPRAHKIMQDDPERTIEFIAFISLLAKLVDDAKKVSAQPKTP